MRVRVSSDLWVCQDCYVAHHYGPAGDGIEYGATWDRETYVETVNTLSENGVILFDNVCSDHETDGETACQYCGSADYDSGRTVFSKASCDICWDRLGGSRYRLAAVHYIDGVTV